MRPSSSTRPANYIVALDIASVRLAIRASDTHLVRLLREKYGGVLSPSASTFDVSVFMRFGPRQARAADMRFDVSADGIEIRSPSFDASLSFKSGTGEILISSDLQEQRLERALRFLASVLVVRHGGVMLHAAGIIREGKGYVFFGPSGAGKSTVTNHSLRHTVLSDEHVIVRLVERGVIVESVPFWNPERISAVQSGTAPLARLVSLRQDTVDRLESVPVAVGSALLMQQAGYVNEHPAFLDELIRITGTVAERCPVDILHFRKSDEFWKLL